MTTLIGISGSIRRGSYNSALLRTAVTLMPAGAELRIESIADFPLYNGDEEAAHGIPEPAARVREAIAAAEGLLLVTPEYNSSMPGVAKNAFDWLSRPRDDVARVFKNKPVAIAGASPNPGGTELSQSAWLPVFRTLGADVWAGETLAVPYAEQVFDEKSRITDTGVRDALRKFVASFVAYAARRREQ